MTESILANVAAGRLNAVDDCLKRFSGPVWSIARRYSRTEQDAEDAVQEVFLDLWKSASRYDPDAGSEMTFVMTIARRRLIDRNRRQERTPKPQALPEPEVLAAEDGPDLTEVGDEADRIREAMKQLRPEQQRVLQMSLVQGHSHQQVAERTGLPLGTVKSHARRGLMRVREMLGVDPLPQRQGGKS